MAENWKGEQIALAHGEELEALRSIGRNDPDGGQVQPTEASYAEHEKWARATFGDATWERYSAGGWDDREPAW